MQLAFSRDTVGPKTTIVGALRSEARIDVMQSKGIIKAKDNIWNTQGAPQTRHHRYPYKKIMDETAAKIQSKQPTIIQLLEELDTNWKALPYGDKKSVNSAQLLKVKMKMGAQEHPLNVMRAVDEFLKAFVSYTPNVFQAPNSWHTGDDGGDQEDKLENPIPNLGLDPNDTGWSIKPANQAFGNPNNLSITATTNWDQELSNGATEARSSLASW